MVEHKIYQTNLKSSVSTDNKINEAEFLEVLNSPEFKNIFVNTTSTENLTFEIRKCIEDYVSSCDTPALQSQFITAGIACLLSFIQQNWTGPAIQPPELPGFNCNDLTTLKIQREKILAELVQDGENIVSVVEYPELLFVASIILAQTNEKFGDLCTKIWYMRYLFIHQQILEEHSVKIFTSINEIINDLKKLCPDIENQNLKIELHLEFGRIYLYYGHVQKSKDDIDIAVKYSGIQTSLMGALGKRTKFQKEDLAQLMLKVDVDEKKLLNSTDKSNHSHFPVDVSLDDEIRLNKIEYTEKPDGEFPELGTLQQAVILGILVQTQKSQPKDKLADEELQPMISCILDKPKNWSIQFSTLLIRSKLESNHKRTVMRAMMQAEALIDCLGKSESSFKDRLQYFFVSHLPPKWVLKSIFAGILISTGSIKSALDIYLSLEEWENAIHCYNALQLRHKAQEIIEQELKKNSTPKLWCLLGDATDDVNCYQKAWEISNERSARAQRHWAYFLFRRKEYGASIEHFQKSLEINSLQCNLWFNLGFAALTEEKWEISAQAYRTYCSLEPESFEAWNNLARCYCELKQKRRAWKALREALKVDYSNWRIWDNYMLVSSDLKEFDEVIRSYHQVLNLKEKHLDIPVLKSLVYGLLELLEEEETSENNDQSGESENYGEFIKKLREKLLALFGRLTSQIMNDPELWYLYSEIPEADSTEGRNKKHQLLLKAHRSAVNKQGWEKDVESCKKILEMLSKLIDVSLLLQESSALKSCKMAASGTVIRIKKEHVGSDICDNVEEKLNKVKELIES